MLSTVVRVLVGLLPVHELEYHVSVGVVEFLPELFQESLIFT